MKVQFLKPPAPPKARPEPPKPEPATIPRPDTTPEEPEPELAPEPEPEVPEGPVRVEAGRGPGLIRKVEPVYPPIAQAARLQGTVQLDVIVHADGSLGEVRILESANPIFEASAREAVEQWLFAPGDHDVIMTVTVHYVLHFHLNQVFPQRD